MDDGFDGKGIFVHDKLIDGDFFMLHFTCSVEMPPRVDIGSLIISQRPSDARMNTSIK